MPTLSRIKILQDTINIVHKKCSLKLIMYKKVSVMIFIFKYYIKFGKRNIWCRFVILTFLHQFKIKF